ncbi:hypothetical protein Anas_00930 [Armadillidium nasatum]|uniref:RING-type domain-containing protein n=1 Tax=Armadillidium nasatum TaxID=96803 RepID=A0A5N5SIF0_9CRUS|nr:hypothetical protein Anas_00930 [Armadillidium nasatum]
MEEVENKLTDFKCDLCEKVFNVFFKIPKILGCGHNFCCDCITLVEITTKTCPSCQSQQSKVKNNLGLDLVGQVKEKYAIKNYTHELRNMRNDLLIQQEVVSKYRSHYLKQLIMADELLMDLSNLLKDSNVSNGKSRPNLMELAKNSFFSSMKDARVTPLLNFSPTDSNNFLKKICEKIRFGERILTVHHPNFGSEFKYGLISVLNNEFLSFHCLSLKNSEGCQEYVKFDDLKKIVASSETNVLYMFRLFLKLRTSEDFEDIILIRVINSLLVPQFIRLCTGESGSSYKDAEYICTSNMFRAGAVVYNDRRINLKGYNNDDIESDFGNVDYALKAREYVTISKNKECIVSDNRGGFQILCPINDERRNDCIGEIESPLNMLNAFTTYGRVIDCGICFKIRM